MNAPSMKRKRKEGKRLTEAQRLEIISELERPNRLSLRELGRKFDVDAKVICRIKKDKQKIKDRTMKLSDEALQSTKRIRTSDFPELEKKLLDWIEATCIQGFKVTPMMIKHKALDIAQDLHIPDFVASNGWTNGFRRRYNLKTSLQYGECGGESNHAYMDDIEKEICDADGNVEIVNGDYDDCEDSENSKQGEQDMVEVDLAEHLLKLYQLRGDMHLLQEQEPENENINSVVVLLKKVERKVQELYFETLKSKRIRSKIKPTKK